jgi:GMP synthase (glutamine-hydrolysing)
MCPSLLVVEMGLPGESLRSKHGSFGEWFERAFAQMQLMVEIRTTPVADATATMMSDFAGVVLTGAEEGVYDHLPWRSRFDDEMKRVIESGPPVLGVCFSHQYLCELLGGRVERMKSGGEIGRFELALTAEGAHDPLFEGVESNFTVLETHNDAVIEPQPGATLLASSEKVAWQAFRWGERIRGVQFHPEMNKEILESVLARENASKEDFLRARGPHAGLLILRNFVDICLAG